MKQNILLKVLSVILLTVVASIVKAQSGDNKLSKEIEVKGPFPYITQAQLTEMHLENHDATMPFIRLGDNDYWVYISEGGKTDGKHSNIKRIRTTLSTIDKTSIQDVHIHGIPDAGVNQYNGWKAWMMNLYHIKDKEYLAVLHLEDQNEGTKEEFKMAIAYSKDGAINFRFLGFMLDVEMPVALIKQGNSKGLINIAGAGLTWDDKYFYLYFSDMAKEDRSDRRLAIARALKKEVIANARKGKNAKWNKYYNAKWEEPGLGGGRSSSLGKMAEYHTTIMYNTYLKKWLLFDTQKGYITMRASANPLDFNVPHQRIYKIPEGSSIAYITIHPKQQDMTTCGKDFNIYYRVFKKKEGVFDTDRMEISLK